MDALRKQRGMTKGKLTRLEAKVQEAENFDISREEIEVYIERLAEIHKEYDDIQRQITSNELGEPSVADASAGEEFDDRYLSMQVKLKRALRDFSPLQDEARALSTDDTLARVLMQQADIMQRIESNGGGHAQATTGNDAIAQLLAQQTEMLRRFTDERGAANADSKVKLPVVELPKFSGRIEEWMRFSESYKSLIHNNASIPAVQKFQYLERALSGVAAKVIESIDLSAENYTVAWELLEKRFDDQHAIKKKHIQGLFAMPRINTESPEKIRELVDHTLKHLRVLKSMELPTESWDQLIIHMMESKLDDVTLRDWEQKGNQADATLAVFTDFLQSRCQMLERIKSRSMDTEGTDKAEPEKSKGNTRKPMKGTEHQKKTTLAVSTESARCYSCNGEHLLYHCKKFLALSADERFKEVLRLKLCVNCLRNDHFSKSCKMRSCKECSGRHNTLIHRPSDDQQHSNDVNESETASTTARSNTSSNVAVHHAANRPSQQHVLMATATVNASRPNGCNVQLRILLDSASEAHFITDAACTKLGVKRNRTSEIVTGLNERESIIVQKCDVVIKSRISDFQANVRCLVVPNITKHLPSAEVNRDTLNIPSSIKLADLEFHKTNAIDILVGAELFFELLESGKIELGQDLPILQNTKLGWVVAGSITRNHTLASTVSLVCQRETIAVLNCSLDHYETLDKGLERLWEIENMHGNHNQILSNDERYCEEFFDNTTTRDNNGRFTVRLPLSGDPSSLGESRETAIRRLYQLERRLKRNTDLRDRYTAFMREYVELGHMSPVNDNERELNRPIVYLPHHGVIKESSSSTKLRTVFDASSKTSSGISLNDILHVGPTLQSSLFEIILRFRCHSIALTGDLRRMYRQVLVDSKDRDLQRIVWRFSPDEQVQDFRLNTVTYGEASSAYLAIKCIRRLAEQNQQNYPAAARVILDEIYVDDIMSGANTIKEAIELQEQLTAMLQAGGFQIHKWGSNEPGCLVQIALENQEATTSRSVDSTDTIKTLGLEWNPKTDQFQFSVHSAETATTKRQILSAISKFFDPLGLVGPILTSVKLLMQQTWRLEQNWDDPLPTSFAEQWKTFCCDLNTAQTLFISRRVIPCEHPRRIYLHGFCDASESAYGACIYVQTENEDGQVVAQLLCSKSRVAPIKPLSIPRLELCSAVLLARLFESVRKGLKVKIDGIHAWSDSTVALYWIHGDVSRWKTFVRNRVCEIVELLPAKYWRHVRGNENPADLLSRGASASQIQQCELWWMGPRWLMETSSDEFNHETKQECSPVLDKIVDLEERKNTQVCNIAINDAEEDIFQGLLNNHSSLTKIERILAHCLRFASNVKLPSNARVLGHLSTAELREAHFRLVRHVQSFNFADEILQLQAQRNIKSSSKISQLNPFLDDHGVLRVGGRLQLTSLPFDRKHPIILPARDRLVKLLFEREHVRLLHAAQSLLLSSIREHYWPLRGKDMARLVCRSCVQCARNKPQQLTQIMGSLPRDRVCPSRPFTTTGVDFAGPITTLVNKGRGRKTNKSYIAIFVCFATKAVHLEATSELTTAAFLATLRRFIARRGSPRNIYSDNATNFVGGNRELKEMYDFARSQVNGIVGDTLANEGLDWNFIPANSPHMGGLWEAAVKSCKYHLRRVMGNALLTFEELATVLSQIEACLNSRPLCPLSTDPNDHQPLTPAHFLVGGALTNIADVDVTDVDINRLTRWQLIQRLVQDFWKRWAAEYLANLQGRTKWKEVKENLRIDDMVVLKDENLPPLKWKLGRIVELHPGHDGLIRVATIRTSSGNFKRAIVKLCKLPVNCDVDTEISPANLLGGMSSLNLIVNAPNVTALPGA